MRKLAFGLAVATSLHGLAGCKGGTEKAAGGGAPGVKIANGVLSIASSDLLREDPTNLILIFLNAQRHGVKIANSTKRLVRANLALMDDAQRRNQATIDVFFEILGGVTDLSADI